MPRAASSRAARWSVRLGLQRAPEQVDVDAERQFRELQVAVRFVTGDELRMRESWSISISGTSGLAQGGRLSLSGSATAPRRTGVRRW